ncbi:MAG TPA: ABC transporter substrate-binding protein [Terriglobia bacterium]|nr:ABC transporter substrate-binding protein [Terriglobia bacterium]
MTTRRTVLGTAASLAMLGSVPIAWPAPERPKIGVVVTTLSLEFWNDYLKFMKKGAAELGAELVVLNAQNDSDKMIRSIQDLVSRRVDGIIFTPYWSTAARGLSLAKDANIPVVLTDTYPTFAPQNEHFPNYIGFVGPADEDAGYQMALHLFSATSSGSDGKKHIAVVDGTPGTSVAIDRRKGLTRALKEHPEVTIVGEVNGNFMRDTAQSAFESLYQGHPDIRGVWSANGGMANGILAALIRDGKQPGKDVMVVAMDLERENLKPLEDGELVFDIGGHWLEGGFGLIMLYDAINGHRVPADKATVKLELLPLVAKLVPEYKKDYPNGVPVFDFKAHSLTYNPKARPADFSVPDAAKFRREERES